METTFAGKPQTSQASAAVQAWSIKGPAMWQELHIWAMDLESVHQTDWLTQFNKRIPCGECRRHWTELLRTLPPDYSSPQALFEWSVRAHNAVNKRLGKPEMSVPTARTWWSTVAVRPNRPIKISSLLPAPGLAHRATPDLRHRVLAKKDSTGRMGIVNCVHAGPADRASYSTCSLGLFNGKPHAALCNQCSQRKPTTAGLPESLRSRRMPRRLLPQIAPGNKVNHESKEQQRILLRSHLSPGDIVMLTAAVRDLHLAHPNQFLTAVDTSAMGLWDNNPYVTSMASTSGWRVIDMHYPLINQSNQKPYHFIHGYLQYLQQQLALSIPPTSFKGDIHLSEQEKLWQNQVEQEFGFRGPYWIMMAGGKRDFTAKWWSPASYQRVVDHFAGRVQFVQCGQSDHWHPPLKGVFNLIGKTSIRQFVRLMYHAAGVICPVTLAMHLAAAVPTKTGRLRPCVVIAGGREPPHWEAYPGHQFLHTIGALPCCATGGCWRSRCQPIGDGDVKDVENVCERPVQIDSDLRIPQCMAMVKPDDVIRAVERTIAF